MNMTVASNSNCLREPRNTVYPARSNHSDGLTVECICPKCGVSHRLKLIWSGRGKPKKYCPPCKSFVSTMEGIELYSISTDIDEGLEKAV